MATEDDEDAILAMLADQSSDVIEFDTLAQALDAMREYLDADGVVEVHEDGCEGGDDCGCAFVTIAASELMPSAKA